MKKYYPDKMLASIGSSDICFGTNQPSHIRLADFLRDFNVTSHKMQLIQLPEFVSSDYFQIKANEQLGLSKLQVRVNQQLDQRLPAGVNI